MKKNKNFTQGCEEIPIVYLPMVPYLRIKSTFEPRKMAGHYKQG